MKTIAFLATALFSLSVSAESFETYLGDYSVNQVVCYVDGAPQADNCKASLITLENSSNEICLKVSSEAKDLSQRICMREYRSNNRADHTPNNFHEAYFSSDADSVSWIKNIAAGSYRSSQLVTLTSQGSDLILNVSFSEVRSGEVQSRSVFFWLNPRVHTLPVEIPGQ